MQDLERAEEVIDLLGSMTQSQAKIDYSLKK